MLTRCSDDALIWFTIQNQESESTDTFHALDCPPTDLALTKLETPRGAAAKQTLLDLQAAREARREPALPVSSDQLQLKTPAPAARKNPTNPVTPQPGDATLCSLGSHLPPTPPGLHGAGPALLGNSLFTAGASRTAGSVALPLTSAADASSNITARGRSQVRVFPDHTSCSAVRAHGLHCPISILCWTRPPGQFVHSFNIQ